MRLHKTIGNVAVAISIFDIQSVSWAGSTVPALAKRPGALFARLVSHSSSAVLLALQGSSNKQHLLM